MLCKKILTSQRHSTVEVLKSVYPSPDVCIHGALLYAHILGGRGGVGETINLGRNSVLR